MEASEKAVQSFGIDYTRLPVHMRDGARLYVEDGIEPGHFLSAVICNDLKEAFGRADHENTERMRDWVAFFYNDAPAGCHGSAEKMQDWMARGGLRGVVAGR